MNNNYHFRKLVEIDAIHNIYISNLDEGKKLMDLVGVGSAQCWTLLVPVCAHNTLMRCVKHVSNGPHAVT